MKFSISASIISLLLLASSTTVVADPVPSQCRVFCFRITDIRADENDPELDKFHIEFEVLNWADQYAAGVSLNLASLSSPGVRFVPDTFFNLNGVDADGRPIQKIDTNSDTLINDDDLEDTIIKNGILDPGEDKNANNRLDNDPMPGNLNRINNWSQTVQTDTKMEWEAGDALPFINLQRNVFFEGSFSLPVNDCTRCISSLANLDRAPGTPVIVDRITGVVSPPEAIDDGDNVQDGFVMTIDGLGVGDTVHINWFLTAFGPNAPFNPEFPPGMPEVCRATGLGNPNPGDPLGTPGQGNAYGFGLVSLTRIDRGPLPGPVFVGNAGAGQGPSLFFGNTFVVEPGPAIMGLEFGAGLTAQFANPADNTFGASVSAQPQECPLTPSCCEEDCCEKDTTWVSPQCISAPGSPGWTGAYSSDYTAGCVWRECCEEDCCGAGTTFDAILGCCVSG